MKFVRISDNIIVNPEHIDYIEQTAMGLDIISKAFIGTKSLIITRPLDDILDTKPKTIDDIPIVRLTQENVG